MIRLLVLRQHSPDLLKCAPLDQANTLSGDAHHVADCLERMLSGFSGNEAAVHVSGLLDRVLAAEVCARSRRKHDQAIWTTVGELAAQLPLDPFHLVGV
jgi:hypothetical protein